MTPTIGSSDQRARDRFRTIALTQLAEIEHKLATGGDLGLASLTLGFYARLLAFARGDWRDASVRRALDRLLAMKTEANSRGSSGFLRIGQGTWDAFGDGTLNTADTIYTVTLADHIGPTILEAARHGALPAGEVGFVIDALLALPVVDTPFGPCLVYSDSPSDAGFATVNVSVGAAAFLRSALDAGFERPGQREMVDRLTPFATATYGVAVPHWWPYAYCLDPDNPRYDVGWIREPAQQDWNHEAYTAESAATLGLPVGDAALVRHLRHPAYNPLGRPLTRNRARDVMGRLRMLHLRPDVNPRNSVTDAEWYFDNWGTHREFAASENAQLGLWCARLAENARSLSLRDFVVHDIDPATADGQTAEPGSRVVVSSLVRNAAGVGIVDKRVELRRAGSQDDLLQVMRTGLRGDVEFVETMPDHDICYAVVAQNGTASERVCVQRSVSAE